MKQSDSNNIKPFLKKEGFVFKKSLGQNFLIDGTVAPRMAEFAACGGTGVIEIGPGAGVLTKELSIRAKRVVAIELDKSLAPVLEKALSGCENIKLIFCDVLKTDLKKVIEEDFSDCENVSVCANLPYYITSPVIMKLLKEKLPVKNITVMVQKEAAERICAAVGSRKAGAVTAIINYYALAKPLFFVPRQSFFPAPQVDSEVINLELRKEPPVKVSDEEFFFRTVNACFALRRKTALNSLSATLKIDKQIIKDVFLSTDIDENARGESFDMETLALLSEKLYKLSDI